MRRRRCSGRCGCVCNRQRAAARHPITSTPLAGSRLCWRPLPELQQALQAVQIRVRQGRRRGMRAGAGGERVYWHLAAAARQLCMKLLPLSCMHGLRQAARGGARALAGVCSIASEGSTLLIGGRVRPPACGMVCAGVGDRACSSLSMVCTGSQKCHCPSAARRFAAHGASPPLRRPYKGLFMTACALGRGRG